MLVVSTSRLSPVDALGFTVEDKSGITQKGAVCKVPSLCALGGKKRVRRGESELREVGKGKTFIF